MSQGPSRGSWCRRTHTGSLLRYRRLRRLLQIGPRVTGSSHSSPLHSSTSCKVRARPIAKFKGQRASASPGVPRECQAALWLVGVSALPSARNLEQEDVDGALGATDCTGGGL